MMQHTEDCDHEKHSGSLEGFLEQHCPSRSLIFEENGGVTGAVLKSTRNLVLVVQLVVVVLVVLQCSWSSEFRISQLNLSQC